VPRDEHPVIVGMNNPLSEDPRAALMPYPRGSAGWRLWRMVSDVCGIGRAEWMRRTERVNLCDTKIWDPRLASAKAERLWPTLRGRRVVLCGRLTQQILRLSDSHRLEWRESDGVTWCWIPHPSGLCREYNDPLMREVVGLRFEELLS